MINAAEMINRGNGVERDVNNILALGANHLAAVDQFNHPIAGFDHIAPSALVVSGRQLILSGAQLGE